MRVLHLNIRLSEGGAARVALEIHKRLIENGIHSRYGYGYGKGGLDSPIHHSTENVFRITDRYTVIANYAIHQLFGIDCFQPYGGHKMQLLDEINQADIVHLHAIHSYYLPFKWLFNQLILKRKRIIWTAHDHWMITGRCAFTEMCEGWRHGCGTCKVKTNYPPTKFDFSRSQLLSKIACITQASSRMLVISPSAHLARDILSQYPNINIRTVPNSIDAEIERIASKSSYIESSVSNVRVRKVLIVANDLAYQGKTNRDVVNRIAALANVKLITVGKNSPFIGSNVFNYGEVVDRNQLFEIYQTSDVFLFTSTVDNFPLVLCEAQSAGCPVLSTPSAAGKEVLGFLGGFCLSADTIEAAISESNFFAGYATVKSRHDLASSALEQFGGQAMMNRYLSLYDEIMVQQ